MMGLVEVAVMLLQVIYPYAQDDHNDQDQYFDHYQHDNHPQFRREPTQRYRMKMDNQLQR